MNALEGSLESPMGQQHGGNHVERGEVVVGVRVRTRGVLEPSEEVAV